MVTLGLLVKMEAKPGKDSEVEELLLSALPIVRREATTTAWFAVRFGRSEYGIFDVFPDEAAREAHLSGVLWKNPQTLLETKHSSGACCYRSGLESAARPNCAGLHGAGKIRQQYRRGSCFTDSRTAQRSSIGALFTMLAPPARHKLLETTSYSGRTMYTLNVG